MMEFGSMSQPFRVGPDMNQPILGGDCTNYALPDYYGRVENSHLPGYNLNNEPYKIPETFAHRPDPEAHDYYNNLNEGHRWREFNVRHGSHNVLNIEPVQASSFIDGPPLFTQQTTSIQLATPRLSEMAERIKENSQRESASIAQILEKRKIEMAKRIARNNNLTVYDGYGNSHFSHVRNEGWHVTTQIPGIGKREGFTGGFSLHDLIDP